MKIFRKIQFPLRGRVWILVLILVIFSLSIFIYFFFFRNVFSRENIILKLSAPEEINSGEEITWLLSIKNQSEVKIQNLNLIFEYPSGVLDKEGLVKKRETKVIDEILPGDEKKENFSGVIFGKKDEVKKASAFLNYTPENLTLKFESQTPFLTRISKTSVLFFMEIPTKVNPREEFPISLKWQSGFGFPLENVEVRLLVPEEFEETWTKTPREAIDKTIIFKIGILNENEGGQTQIKGELDAKVGDQKLFKADFGIFDETLYTFIPLASKEIAVKIVSSTLDIFRKINGEYDYNASPGETLNYIIEFKNTGEDIYRDLTLIVELESDVLDFSAIVAPGGKQEGKKIIFSSKNFPDLLFLGPYGEGEVGFKVNVKEYTKTFHPQNGQIRENIIFGGIEKTFQTKVSSMTSFSQEVYFTKEKLPLQVKDFFENTGPFPLQSNQETTLVVLFNIKNLGNSLRNVKIEIKLGENVEYLEDKVYPTDTKMDFDKDSKKLTIDVGSLSYYLPLKIFAIQIKIKPKMFPETVVSKSKIFGKDSWLGQTFKIEVPSLNTDLIQ